MKKNYETFLQIANWTLVLILQLFVKRETKNLVLLQEQVFNLPQARKTCY